MAETYTDAITVLNQRLAALGPVSVTMPFQVEETYKECRPSIGSHSREGGGEPTVQCDDKKRIVSKTRLEQRNLTVSDAEISSNKDAVFSAVVTHSFPNDLIENSLDNINCSQSVINASVNFTLTANKSQSIAINDSITTTITGMVSTKASLFGQEISAQLTLSQGRTQATTTTSGSSGGYTITGSGSFAVPAGKRILARLSSYKVQASAPFKIPVIVDGNLSPNDGAKKRLAEVLSEQDRTFIISGELISNDVSKGQLDLLEMPVDLSRCASQQGLLQTAVDIPEGSRSYLSRIRIKNKRVISAAF